MSFEPVKDPAVTVKLSKPIQFMGVPISEIAIREPTAGDMFRAGNPVKYDMRNGELDFDEQKAFAMVSRLSGIGIEGSLEKMTTNDALACFWAICPFFIPGMRRPEEEQPSQKPDAPLAS